MPRKPTLALVLPCRAGDDIEEGTKIGCVHFLSAIGLPRPRVELRTQLGSDSIGEQPAQRNGNPAVVHLNAGVEVESAQISSEVDAIVKLVKIVFDLCRPDVEHGVKRA